MNNLEYQVFKSICLLIMFTGTFLVLYGILILLHIHGYISDSIYYNTVIPIQDFFYNLKMWLVGHGMIK